MKYKFFSSDSPTGIETTVNNWVSQQKSVVNVKLSDTKMQFTAVNGKKITVVTVGVWYD
jgi:hypothetical protein